MVWWLCDCGLVFSIVPKVYKFTFLLVLSVETKGAQGKKSKKDLRPWSEKIRKMLTKRKVASQSMYGHPGIAAE